MLRSLIKLLGIGVVLLLLVAISTLKLVDRTPYKVSGFYEEMNRRLDSLHNCFEMPIDTSLWVGWSKVNATPAGIVPLAGYGSRDPMNSQGIHDSSFVRTIIFKTNQHQVAIVTADLLIIHPELSRAVLGRLPAGWDRQNVYFTASHTHSGQGGWAPGVVGRLFAGAFDEEHLNFLGNKIIESIALAERSMSEGIFSVGEMEVEHLVRNRLAKEKGTLDPWLKTVNFQKKGFSGILSFYAAHATCFGIDNHLMSGDYPAALIKALESDSLYDFAAFGAGAVGSMAPSVRIDDGWKSAEYMAYHLKDQLMLFSNIGLIPQRPQIHSFQLNLPMRDPHFKISENIALRPYLFRSAFGDYQNHLSVMILGKCIFIGMPCDFSGELAVPLYQKARELGYQLVITSFNGDYAGYVIKDEWYDMPKYEARTMSWYGPDAGSYLSEITTRIIDIVHEHQ